MKDFVDFPGLENIVEVSLRESLVTVVTSFAEYRGADDCANAIPAQNATHTSIVILMISSPTAFHIKKKRRSETAVNQ